MNTVTLSRPFQPTPVKLKDLRQGQLAQLADFCDSLNFRGGFVIRTKQHAIFLKGGGIWSMDTETLRNWNCRPLERGEVLTITAG